jgi:hypothetical protein
MKKLALALMLTTAITVSGCAAVSQWWQNFKNNPIAQIQTFEQGVQTVLTLLEGAWNFIQPFIPASALPVAQQQYANAVSSVGHAESVLEDAVNGAVAAQQSPMPDFTTLMAAISDAVSQVVAIIDTYKGAAPVNLGDAGVTASRVAPPGLEEARARNLQLRSFRVQ